MQSTHLRKLLGTILICLIVLTSCNFSLVRTVEVTRVHTVVVTELLVIVESATPGPAIELPPASGTPNPFVVWNSGEVAEAFRRAGLEVDHPRPMTSDDYGLVPMLAIEGTRFFIPSVCADCGGRIMSFANLQDLAIVQDYYAQMARFGAVLASWVYVKDNILLQINGELAETAALKYKAVLDELVK